MFDETKRQLALAYDGDAKRRAASAIAGWKLEEREHFLQSVLQENKGSLLEIGAGTGKDGLFFQENGLDVTCVDLSPEMVRHCREQGLRAEQMDFYELKFPDGAFDAVYALNCLLHVPKRDLASVLEEIRRVLKPDGLFFLGVYGGMDSEGVWEGDWCEPKRLFVSYTDEALQTAVNDFFDIVEFRTLSPEEPGRLYFQRLLLRKR